jgi:hypothetical protein
LATIWPCRACATVPANTSIPLSSKLYLHVNRSFGDCRNMARVNGMAAIKKRCQRSLAIALLVLAGPAFAVGDGLSINVSGFGTIGAARSDQPWTYQRFLRNRVSFERDTAFGLQADVALNRHWSATVQGKLAPSSRSDSKWRLDSEWAFVAWRPNNDWLLRAGKFRVPFQLRSEVMDVGQAYDEARLPSEVYSAPPTSNFRGLYVSRNLEMGDAELNVDFYVGNDNTVKRQWVREDLRSLVAGDPPLYAAGPVFRKMGMAPKGLVVTWRTPKRVLRAGLHHIKVKLDSNLTNDSVGTPAWVQVVPGLGYWQTSNLIPGPGIGDSKRFSEWALTLSGEWYGSQGWRMAADFVRVWQRHSERVQDEWGGALTVYKTIGRFVPYGSLSTARSPGINGDWARTLDASTVPSTLPGADLLNGAMHTAADMVPIYDQQSLALGTSYALTPSAKVKLEWLHSRISMSSLVDLPAGEPLYKRRKVNVLSASYSFVF